MKKEKDKFLEDEKTHSDDIFEPSDTSLVIRKNKENTKSLDDEIKTHDFLTKKKNDELDLERKKVDIRFYKIQKVVNLFVGLLLVLLSFIVYGYGGDGSTTEAAGAFLLGCGLAALGINTVNFKSLMSKNEE